MCKKCNFDISAFVGCVVWIVNTGTEMALWSGTGFTVFLEVTPCGFVTGTKILKKRDRYMFKVGTGTHGHHNPKSHMKV